MGGESRTNKIRLVNLGAEYKEIQEEVLGSIESVLEEGSFILGKNVSLFEEEFSKYVGSRFGVGVASGTDALLMALRAVGVGAGDEVITVSHTFVATVDAITRLGAKPVLIDVDERTYNIDVRQVARRITKRTKAIVPVHLYGQPARLLELRELSNKFGLSMVQDACQAHGATINKRKLGYFGDVLCYSFYPSKNLGAYGDGGMIVTRDSNVAETCRMLRNYGQSQKYHHDLVGYNSRLDEIQAACLLKKLRHLDEWIEKRRKVALRYSQHFASSRTVSIPFEDPDAYHVFYLYVLRVKQRQKIINALARAGIETGIHYPIPVHLQRAYPTLGSAKLPVTEEICGEILSLPMHPFLTEREQSGICQAIERDDN